MYQSFKIMCRHDLATVFKEGGPAIVIEDYLIPLPLGKFSVWYIA